MKKQELLELYNKKISKLNLEKSKLELKIKGIESSRDSILELGDLFSVRGHKNYFSSEDKTFIINKNTLNRMKIHTDKFGMKRVSLFMGVEPILFRIDKLELIR